MVSSKGNGGWANPAPAGLVALAVACFVFMAIQLGYVKSSASGLLGIWLIGGFVVQVIVGVIELREGNSTAGNVFTYFSAYFMLAVGLGLIFKFLAQANGWEVDTRIDGWAWLPLSAGLTLWTPAYFKSPKTLLAVVVCLLPALWVVTFTDMGVWSKDVLPVSAWFLCASGSFALYTSAAMVINTAYGRAIVPTGKPLAG